MPEGAGQFVRFAAIGAAGFAVDVLVLYLALGAGLGPFGARALSFLAAVWFTWELNRRHTFGKAAAQARWWRYLLAMLGGGTVNYATYGALMLALPDTPLVPLFGVALGSGAGLAFNFLSAKFFVFRH